MPFSNESLEDFSSARLLVPTYLGSDEKCRVEMDGSVWMLKFGAVLDSDPSQPLLGSYNNAPLSEYLGCHIASALGIDAQETRLGTFNGRLVVACRDFIHGAGPETELIEFSKIENGTVGVSSTNRKTPEYEFTMSIFDNSPFLEDIRGEAKERFWQTFCLDALIGNHDRHASNWGYLANRDTNRIYACAPVYDCGSCLCAMLAEDQMKAIQNSRETHRNRVLGRPKARLLVDGKPVRYGDFLMSENGREARSELVKMSKRIDLISFNRIIDGAPGISDTRRSFLKAEVSLRLSLLLSPALRLAQSEAKGFRSEEVGRMETERRIERPITSQSLDDVLKSLRELDEKEGYRVRVRPFEHNGTTRSRGA